MSTNANEDPPQLPETNRLDFICRNLRGSEALLTQRQLLARVPRVPFIPAVATRIMQPSVSRATPCMNGKRHLSEGDT